MAPEARTYRKRFHAEDVTWFPVRIAQTDLWIGVGGADGKPGNPPEARTLADVIRMAEEETRTLRNILEMHIRVHPAFLTSLSPLDCPDACPAVLHSMYEAARAAEVGPMAAVAGMMAERVGKRLATGFSEVLVENGGDLWMAGTRERIAGLSCGNSPLSGRIALRLAPDDFPLGLCTSSGTVGHSLSFGHADAATVLADSAALADAVATGLGNRVKTRGDIEPALAWAMGIPKVRGALVVLGEHLGVMGDMTLAPVNT